MEIAAWILKIVSLIPIIAQGVQAVHADKAANDKTAIASDVLTDAIAGSAALLPVADQQTALAVGNVAQTALAATVQALHVTAASPAPAPVVG